MKYLETIDYVRGPYTDRKSGRKGIEVYTKDGRRRYASYPKFLVEVVLGRELDRKLETIDHIDHDFTNNSWDNLRVIDMSRHMSEDQTRVRLVSMTCVWCGGATKQRRPGELTWASKVGAGPFCDNRCSGEYGAAVQNNALPETEDRYNQWDRYVNAKRIYYTITKVGETVADVAERLRLSLPTEDEVLAALPRWAPPERLPKPSRPCAVCGATTENKKFCSYTCTNKASHKIKWPAKEKLQRLVWKYPSTYIAKRLGVSDKAVANQCKKLCIDKPPRGYWAKQRANKT
ncbi:hypothetical protein LCGC14_0916390 [marine sediment metagenome]|uniref:HNH nuclease domain-containing protein n=1 Tax=marine sediment metagenome TaxID=412755 RepID=A0A0F9RYV5_9ZZZZ